MVTRSNWHSEDAKPWREWVADLEAKYGKRIAAVIVASPPPRRRRQYQARNHLTGMPTAAVAGSAERPDAAPSAVDFRHHRARVEAGR